MAENKNLNHTFCSDMNMPFYLIRFGSLYSLNKSITVSLIEVFFFFFFSFFFFLLFCLFLFVFFCFFGGGGGGGGGEEEGGGGLWSYVHHTVDVRILCSDVVRPSGCPFIFSVRVIFDDPVKVIW